MAIRFQYPTPYGVFNARVVGRQGSYINFVYLVPVNHPGYQAWYNRVSNYGIGKLRVFGRPQRGRVSILATHFKG